MPPPVEAPRVETFVRRVNSGFPRPRVPPHRPPRQQVRLTLAVVRPRDGYDVTDPQLDFPVSDWPVVEQSDLIGGNEPALNGVMTFIFIYFYSLLR